MDRVTRNLIQTKQKRVMTSRNVPYNKDGDDGDMRIVQTTDGVSLYTKYKGKWYTDSSEPIEGTDVLSTGEAGGSKFLREDGDGTCSWQTPAGGGGSVSTTGSPVDDEYAKFTNGTTIEGRNYSDVKLDLSLDNVENTALSTLDAADLTGASGSADQVLTSDGTNASWEDAGGGGGGEVGGEYGINVETLSGNKTLTAGTDEIYQYLDTGGSNRDITLDTGSASAGDRFILKQTRISAVDTTYLKIKQSTTTLDYVYAGGTKEFIFDGTNWVSGENGTGSDTDNFQENISIGYLANGARKGLAIGPSSYATNEGVAVGNEADGHNAGVSVGVESDGNNSGSAIGKGATATTYGVGIGYSANGDNYGVALGYNADTNDNQFSVALGPYSETERMSEIAHNINKNDSDQENNITIGGWEGSTSNATPTEIFCGGTASQRFTIRASSVLSFKLQVVARDNTAGEVAVYHFAGAIKRDGSNNTALVGDLVKDIIAEEYATWDVAVTADDSNEALKIEVTGDGSNTVQWAARGDMVETHF